MNAPRPSVCIARSTAPITNFKETSHSEDWPGVCSNCSSSAAHILSKCSVVFIIIGHLYLSLKSSFFRIEGDS
jgi:hypothetical protein